MRSGLLRDYVQFEERIVSGNDQAGQMVSWASAFSTWAEPRRLSELNCDFIIRYREGITPASHRIIWDDALWTIVTVVHDLKRTQLTITCDFSNLVEVTHFTSTETEYIDGIPVLRPRE